MKSECTLLAWRLVHTPAPTTLHITDGLQGKVNASKAQGRAFQLTVEEARLAPNVIVGMCLFYIFVELFFVYVEVVIFLGTCELYTCFGGV